MRSRWMVVGLAVIALVVTGCGDGATTGSDTTGADAVEDTGGDDALPSDTQVGDDTAEADTAAADTTIGDTGPGDTGPGDTAEADTAESDSTEADTTVADTVADTVEDTTETDTAETDTVETDTVETDTVETDTTAPPQVVYDPIPGHWSEDFTFALPGLIGGDGPRAYTVVRDAASGDVYVGGSFEAVGELPSPNIARWNDATGWTSLGAGLDIVVRALVLGGDGALYAAGSASGGGWGIGGPTAIYRWYGGVWETIGWIDEFDKGAALAWLDGQLYLGGSFFAVQAGDFSGVTDASNLATWDGSWHAVAGAPNGEVSAIIAHAGSVCVGGSFSDLGGVAASNVACRDGDGWHALGDGLNSTVNVLVSEPGGTLLAGGSFSFGSPTTGFRVGLGRYSAGTGWAPVAGGVVAGDGTTVWTIVPGPSGEYYIGGNFNGVDFDAPIYASNIARLDGDTWTTYGDGAKNQLGLVLGSEVGVRGFAVDNSGRVIAGGLFTTLDGVSAVNIARYRPALPAWEALVQIQGRNLGIAGGINSLAVDVDGGLVVGGFFDSAGGSTTPNVARLDGNAWESLGDGLDGTVWAVHAASDGSVYAGGLFSGGFKRFDGTVWSTVGGGVDDDVRGMTEDTDGSLIVGGSLVTAGGVTVNHIGRWDGAAWSAFGTGVNGQVNAAAFGPDGALYIGGFFTGTSDYDADAGTGTALSRVARWTGDSWEPLGSGLSEGFVRDIAIYDGKLLVVGQFKKVDGVDASSVALWDGTTWAPVGSGSVFRYSWGGAIPIGAVAVQANGFFVAGAFAWLDNGGQTLNCVAWWDGQDFVPLGAGTSDIVEDVAITPDGRSVFLGGVFTAAGDLNSLSLARWDFDDVTGTVVEP